LRSKRVPAAGGRVSHRRLRRSNVPRLEKQARPLEHVAGELPRELPFEDVAVLFADVAAGDEKARHRGASISASGIGAQSSANRKPRIGHVPQRDDVDPSELERAASRILIASSSTPALAIVKGGAAGSSRTRVGEAAR
jgi:hypothetical protein